jgi:CRISPR-associated protein Cas5d
MSVGSARQSPWIVLLPKGGLGMMEPRNQILEVWGELACFSRPELKVERFSYPVITPSAARGIFDAIYCKPHRDLVMAQFRWQVTRIEVLSMPSYISLRRNEVIGRISSANVRSWMRGTKSVSPLLADSPEQRTQRQTVALKNVHYRLHAHIQPWPGHAHRIQALESQFRRRASRGQCFHHPYFGCREFPAFFELLDEGVERSPTVPWSADLGLMLYDVFDLSLPGDSDSEPCISLFQARVNEGVMLVPRYESSQVLKGERR